MMTKAKIPLPATAESLREWMTTEAVDVFWERIWDLDGNYDLPLTNNTPRIQDGVQLYAAVNFGMDVLALFAKVLNVQAGLEKSDYFP